MKELTKKCLKVGATLAGIAGISALLIGLTNLVTAPKIEANNEEKAANALKAIYGTADSFGDYLTNFEDETKYLVSYCIAKKGDTELGYVYKTDGTNSFGEIALMVGISGSGTIGAFSVLTNTETLATTLEDGYLTPLANATAANKTTALEDVSCGATYGAKLVRDMIKEAQTDYLGKQKTKIFPEADSFEGPKNDWKIESSYLSSYYVAKQGEATLGYIYKTTSSDDYGTISLFVGISGTGDIGNFMVITNTQSNASDLQDEYLTPLADATDKETALDNVEVGGSTLAESATVVRDMIKAAQSDYKARL